MHPIEVIVVGGGQAGLAVSHELTQAGVEHVVLESGRIGEAWRRRWDSFCLVTPNWSVQLPGHPYDGSDPDGFMLRDEIVSYLERYAAAFDAPVRQSERVESVGSGKNGGFDVLTGADRYRARSLIVATGAFQRPFHPAGADSLPDSLLRIDVAGYQSPAELPPGGVLIVGSGQSGCQIAEELHESGRQVVLACGRAAWAPRRIGDRDLVWWLDRSGFLDASVESLPSAEARLFANVLASGHDGGHDLHLRTLRSQGVTLTGHFLGADAQHAHFASDLADSIAWGDARYEQLMGLFRKYAQSNGCEVPEIAVPDPFDPVSPAELDLAGFGTVLFAGGFRPDYASWLPWPGAFDEQGFPIQSDGASTRVEGLYFLGTHFLRKRKSSLMIGVGEDARIVARALVN